jgi:hypothetical protein
VFYRIWQHVFLDFFAAAAPADFGNGQRASNQNDWAREISNSFYQQTSLMEMVVNQFGNGLGNALDGSQIVYASFRHRFCRAEVAKQRFFPGRSNAGNLVQQVCCSGLDSKLYGSRQCPVDFLACNCPKVSALNQLSPKAR